MRKREKNFLATDELLFRPPGPTPNSIHAWQKRHPIPEMAGQPILGLFLLAFVFCVCARVMGILISRLAVTKETGCL